MIISLFKDFAQVLCEVGGFISSLQKKGIYGSWGFNGLPEMKQVSHSRNWEDPKFIYLQCSFYLNNVP